MAKRGILEHPKTIELADLLGIPECFAVGLLECLWHHVARYFPHGEITELKPSVLARSIRYPGDAQALWAALLETGFLEEAPNGAVLVHDWSEHADNSVHQLLKKRGENFADGHEPFTRARVRDVNRSGESAAGSQTVHERFTNHSRLTRALPEPEPKPEPDPPPPQGLPNGSGGVDAARLTDEQLQTLESLAGEVTTSLHVTADALTQFRALFADGLTVPQLRTVVGDSVTAKRLAEPGWRAGSMVYFAKACRRALEQPAPVAHSPPAELASATPEWLRDAPRPARYDQPDLLEDLPPL